MTTDTHETIPQSQVDRAALTLARRIVLAGTASVFAINLLVLIGWAFNISVLKSVWPGYITMKANTALSFLFLALALTVFHAPRARHWWKVVGFVACGITILISAMTLAEYLMDVDLRIDQWLFADPEGVSGRFPPGRLAPITALNFLLIGGALILDNWRTPPRPSLARIAQFLTSLAFLASLQAFVGYLLGVTYLFGSAFYTQMAVHTAVSFILLCVGFFFSSPEWGIGVLLLSRSPIAVLTQRILAALVVVPPLVRVLTDWGLRHGWFDSDFAVLMQVMGSFVLMVAIVISAASRLLASQNAQEELAQRERLARGRAEQSGLVAERIARRLELVTNAVPAIILYLDPRRNCRFANERLAAWFGHSSRSAQGLSFAELIGTENAQAHAHEFEQAFRLEVPQFSGPFQTVDGIRHLQVTVVPDQPRQGRTAEGFVLLAVDISEQIQTQRELEKSRRLAEEANQAKTNFLANISHEIRTPLGAVLGYSELLATADATESDRIKFTSTIKRNGEQLLHLIDDILDVSRIETGNFRTSREAFEPQQLVGDLLSTLNVRSAEKSITLKIDVDPEMPEILISDPARIRQCLLNLIGNAIKFTPPQGHVNVACRYERDELHFKVSDDGIGVRPEARLAMFQPFSQGDVSATRRFGGAGLGLALSRRIARALGGDLWLEASEPGHGSVFACRFRADRGEPIKAQPVNAPSGTRQVAMAGVRLAGARVLLVDDSKDNQNLVSRFLTAAGASVTTADDGLQAIDKALHGDFEIVLMDLQMPNMDGYTAIKKLRAVGYKMPIIALTAHAMKEERAHCLAVGFNDHLTKPVNRERLYETISHFMA